MKVKAIAKHFSKASNGRFVVEVENGRHSFTFDAVKEMVENDAPIFNRTVGMIKVIDNDLIITAYK